MGLFKVAALYHFCHLDALEERQKHISQKAVELQIKGTLLIAEEGINGTIAGEDAAVEKLLEYIRTIPGLTNLEAKLSTASQMPFYRLKVKIKKEIVTMGKPGIDPLKKVGTYVSPEAWNELLEDPEVITIDTRNDYEVKIGTFKGAVDPDIKTFCDFPQWADENLDPKENKKVAMFCTGGIRCEKASSYLLEQGFENVFHLKGGILKYLENIPQQESIWDGECFVFDQRVALKHGLQEGQYELCYGCRQPINETHKKHPDFEDGVCCPLCIDVLSHPQKERFRMRQKQIALAKKRGNKHLGDKQKTQPL